MWYVIHKYLSLAKQVLNIYMGMLEKIQVLEPLGCCCSHFLPPPPIHRVCAIPLCSPFPDEASWTEATLWCHKNASGSVSVSGKRVSLLLQDFIYSLENFQVFK